MKKFDLISIGDTTYDVFLGLDEETTKVQCDSNGENCLVLMPFADKVSVNTAIKVPGVGNAANMAVGASRLGLMAGLYTILGKDMTGREALAVFKKEKVATDYVEIDKKKDTNFSAVLSYKGERTILVYHEKRNYNLPKIGPAKWVYLTSLGPGHEVMHGQIIDYIDKTKARLIFNPGTHQFKEGLEVLKPLLQKTFALVVNKEESEKLVGKNDDIKELLKLTKNTGPEIVVITDGPKGSYAFDGNSFYFQDILDTPVFERTGCGDSYSTGFLAASFLGLDVPTAMKWGTVNAAFVIQKTGAQEGLLTRVSMKIANK